ncbi:MAG: hypothetical protein CMB80_03170 [Flammeovirgaceae bacterium]|nr:hypothetical protein [Flammeovirgaceae bacterium]
MKDDQKGRKLRRMPEISYGKCIRKECRSVSDLADGLCMVCWDRTSYKCDLYEEGEDFIGEVEDSENEPGEQRTGNKSHMSNFRY